MTLPELGGLLRDPEWLFVPDTRQLLTRLARDGIGDYRELVGHGDVRTTDDNRPIPG
jgi:hypothetical protein